jgi:AcrR family transcriptional regulator
MGRRSDHTRSELRELMLEEGHRQLAEVGLARFSARDVAKRIGYSVGTLYNVFGSYDELMLAINARTLSLWLTQLRTRLAQCGDDDRIAALVQGYFEFAVAHRQTWVAIYEYNLSDGRAAPEWYQATVAELMGVVTAEIAAALPRAAADDVAQLARSLVATVHGHCVFSLYRTFNLLGEAHPVEAALARVREALAAAQS